MDDFVAGVGPLFGPDFVVVTVNDETGKLYSLQVYPDAHNPELKDAGLPTQYYFQPADVYLAMKQDSPADFDFGMTVFKGLMTSETTLGITPGETTGGDVETGGGFCTFATTFAIPDSVIAGAIEKLKANDHPTPVDRLAKFFNYEAGIPDPRLGIVPITENNVTIAVPDLVKASDGSKAPMYISAQTTGKGSIEAHGRSAFLVTCNELAAGAVAGSLKGGVSPFTVTNELKESFYINAVTVTVHVDVDKVYDSFSAAISVGGFLGIDSASASYAYSNCVTSGGITTQMDENGAELDQKLKDWIDQKVDEMSKTAMDLVKEDIFDWDPSKTDSTASADRSWFSGLFGGSSVSLKSDYQHRSIKYDQTLVLNETIAVTQAVSGDLNDLLPAVKAHPEKYLVIVDVGEWFKKLQIAATCAINFGEKLADGTDLRDPIGSAQLEAGYPDYDQPVQNGQVNLLTLGQGFHYTTGVVNESAQNELAIWTADDAKDIVNMSWLRLDTAVPQWPTDQVKLTRRLVYDGADPRVNISSQITTKDSNGLIVSFDEVTTDHAPVLTAAAVGYVFVRFMIDRRLPPNVTITLTPSIGSDSYEPIVVTTQNETNALWEVFSDKYLNATQISYTVAIEVTGPNFTDDPVTYQTPAPLTASIPIGRLKYINPLVVVLPTPPADKVATINGYIKAATSGVLAPA
jgi:hypothetical protein